MAKTKIEWCDYTINPVKGLCPMDCHYCYARRMYKRFKWNETVRFDPWVYESGSPIPSGSKVFVGSTIELFGDWIKPEWMEDILDYCASAPSVTHIFLTKCPQNLVKWSPFLKNCWVGVSATNWMQFSNALGYLAGIKAPVKFLSFEPLLERIQLDMLQKMLFPRVINWLIIGQQTPVKALTIPSKAWIDEITQEADKSNIPVFLKNNLQCVFDINCQAKLRQEFPVIK